MGKILSDYRRNPSRVILLFVIITVFSAKISAEDLAHPEIASAKQNLTNKQAYSANSMVVTANPYATNAAVKILQAGGSAVDAAIAAQMVLNLVEPQSSGIGGGGFLLFWDNNKQKLTHFNGRETAPEKVNNSHFLVENGKPMGFFDAVVGGYSVGTPGLLKMLEEAHARFGKLPWSALFAEAIQLANEGFIVSTRLNQSLQKLSKSQKNIRNSSMFTHFFQPSGEAVEAGSVLKNPALGKTFELIAKNNSEAFYQGKLAKKIVKAVRNNYFNSGYLSRKDLAQYETKIETALCHSILDYKLCGAPPPSSGAITVIQILSMLSKTKGFHGMNPNSVGFYHRFIEATKLAFADRNQYIADPEFVNIPTTTLVSDNYLQNRMQLIPLLKASNKIRLAGDVDEVEFSFAQSPSLDSTTHLSIIDQQGNIVSLTSSIEHAFGSRIWVDGFLLNNQLTDFSFLPLNQKAESIANRIEPLKRPRSSMSPMIVFDNQNKPILVIGSPGGSWIIPFVAKVIAQHVFLKAPLKQAIESPHIANINRSTTVIEQDTPDDLADQLKQLGHTTKKRALASGIHAIQIQPKNYYGVADSRREGSSSATE